MKIYADLHIHSRYSRATSKNLTIENLEKYARIKGITLLGTGDFTHPKWMAELKEKLESTGTGFFTAERRGAGNAQTFQTEHWASRKPAVCEAPERRNETAPRKSEVGAPINFVLQAELSNMYRQDDKGRRVHNIILAPSFEIVDQINEFLAPRGKLASDGRPIFSGMSCIELCEGLFSISDQIEVIPAHIWTPWFSVLGSKSGFNSIEECYGEYTSRIHALETGLSSDPAMNWRVSRLDKFNFVSNSDTHSFWPWRLGRECNCFDIEPGYSALQNALKTRKGFEFTIEVDPAYGKYHLDGHRKCDVCLSPKESNKLGKKCPACGRMLTIGVLNRVEELADRLEGYVPKNAVPFKTMLPLSEVIALSLGSKSPASVKVKAVYAKLAEKFGNELDILVEAPEKDLEAIAGKKTAGLIIKNRSGNIRVKPGFDGEYGVPEI